ncbi:MAG: DUF559 domain-containing protein [Pseudomonadota bacterium]
MSIQRARDLRRTMSHTERRLWHRLRGGQIEGYRFRRQHPIGSYFADLICLEARLIVEVDGPQHGEAAQQAHDAARTAWLAHEGYRVLRFWAHEIDDDLDGVLTAIRRALLEWPAVRDRPPPPRRRAIT